MPRASSSANTLPPGASGLLKSAEYLKINPLGKLPALVLDGEALPESEVICEYLEDAHPSPTLRPVDPQVRAKVRLLSRLGDLTIAPQLTKLFAQMNPKTRDAAVVDQAFKDMDTALTQIAHFLEGPDYAVGNRLSLADCTLAPLLFFVDGMPLQAFGKLYLLYRQDARLFRRHRPRQPRRQGPEGHAGRADRAPEGPAAAQA